MKPTLARSLIFFFSILVVIESIFSGVFCWDIQNADNTARQELNAVNVCINLGAMFQNFDRYSQAYQTANSNPDREDLQKEANLREIELLNDLKRGVREVSALGSDALVAEKLRKSGLEFVETIRIHKLNNSPSQGKTLFDMVLAGRKVLQHFYAQLKTVHRVAATRPLKHPLGIPPVQLLNLAALVNVVYLVFFALFIERSISSPLGRLTAACEKIRQRLPLGAFPLMRTEIGALQDSFYLMSEQVIETENRRNSYVALLQTVQITALNKVREQLGTLSTVLVEKARSRVERARKSLEALLALLHSMTTQLCASEPTQVVAMPVECDAESIFQEAAMSVEALLQDRLISLEMSACKFQLFVDQMLIGRVVLNFLSNAIKYSPDHGTVTVSASLTEGYFCCSIQDRGPGISEEGRAKLFKRFSQVEAVDGIKRSGTGLGLVICKEIVEAHGGEVGCDSKVGEGSKFWFRIPQGDAARKDHDQQKQPANNTNEKSESLRLPGAIPERIHSIKTNFVVVLVLFILAQVFLFMELHKLFAESAQRTSSYAKVKDELLDTEELYAAYLLFTKRVQISYLDHNVAAAKAYLPIFKEQRIRFSELIGRVGKNDASYESLLKVRSQETKLFKTISYYMNRMDMLMANIELAHGQIETQIHDVERAFTNTIKVQSDAVHSSYDWSQNMRDKILFVLIAAAVADLLIIATAAYIGLGLAAKVLVLKAKAESFAAGKDIAPSLKGKDELSFLDQRLCQVASEIQKAEAEKKEILAIINHDLRTPLASLFATMQILAQGILGELPEKELALAKNAEKELESLLKQINDLLLLEKIDAGSYQLSRQNLSVKELLETSIESYSEICKVKNLNLSIAWANSELQSLELNGDKELLQRLIEIVLKNAIDVSKNNGAIECIVSKQSEKTMLIDVVDQGPGIDAALLPTIFDRFRFVDGKPLAGFGLPLAARICKLHEASIEVKSGSEKPCTIEIKLHA